MFQDESIPNIALGKFYELAKSVCIEVGEIVQSSLDGKIEDLELQ